MALTGVRQIAPDVYVGIDYDSVPHAMVIRWVTVTGDAELIHAELRVEEWTTSVLAATPDATGSRIKPRA